MGTSDFDDMLFGEHDVQDAPEDTEEEDSEDEFLFATSRRENIPWDVCNNANSTSSANGNALSIRETPRYHHQEHTLRPIRDRHWVIARIEAMIELIVDAQLEDHEALTITLKSRATLSRRRSATADGQGQAPEPKERDINFPGASAQEAWNFTVLVRILELIHAGLVDGTVMTKRDMYYRHPDLFIKQSIVDRYVDDLACTFGITRSQLNVTAAAKGLLAGSFRLTRNDGHHINGMSEKEGILVPSVNDNDILDLTDVQWVLVIEKEATFRSLMSSPRWHTLGSSGTILTAKGYPDLASRKLLSQLAAKAPHIPMYALMDLDPDGIAILSTYKYGSYRLAHEDVTCADTATPGLPNIRWLGVKSHHMSGAPLDEVHPETGTKPQLQGLMRLTARDRNKAARMLEWNLCAEEGLEKGWRQELQKMLMLNVKAEMQILDEMPGGVVSWLSDRLGQATEVVGGQRIDGERPDDGMLF